MRSAWSGRGWRSGAEPRPARETRRCRRPSGPAPSPPYPDGLRHLDRVDAELGGGVRQAGWRGRHVATRRRVGWLRLGARRPTLVHVAQVVRVLALVDAGSATGFLRRNPSRGVACRRPSSLSGQPSRMVWLCPIVGVLSHSTDVARRDPGDVPAPAAETFTVTSWTTAFPSMTRLCLR